jgi:hypothetical protein
MLGYGWTNSGDNCVLTFTIHSYQLRAPLRPNEVRS